MTQTKSLRIAVFMGLFSLLFVAAFLTERSFIYNQSNPTILPNNPPATPTSATAVDEPYTGTGNPQEVRVYSTINSSSQNTNGSFPIDSPSSSARLTSAAVNFTYAENYTTLHQVTPYSALDYPRVVNGTYLNFGRLADAIIPSTVTANYTVGTLANWDWAHDNNLATYSNYSANGAFQIRFEVYSNFSNLFISDWVFPGAGNLWFDRSMCMGMDLNFTANVVQTGAAPVSSVGYIVEAEEWGSSLKTVGTGQLSNVTSTIQTTIVNPGIQFINATQGSHFRVTLSYTEGFNITLYEANATVKVVKELDLSLTKQVAMGFDLLGNATVNGFQILIRTVGVPTGVTFSAGLYRANTTFLSESIDSTTMIAHPVGEPLVKSEPVDGTFNGLITFNFSTPVKCNLGNYFIVLNASSPDVYRIATVPKTGGTKHGSSNSFPYFTDIDPDGAMRHILLNSSLGFGDDFWNQSVLDVSEPYRLNAAPFAINVSRGWVPSDANMSVQNLLLSGASYALAHEFPFNGTPGWTWGRGFWNALFPSPISNNDWRFDVPLTWNQTKSQTILFNTTFQATAYALESVTPTFNVTATQNPRWMTNHTIQADTYENWTFSALTFVFPKTWNPSSAQILNPNYNAITSFLSSINTTHYLQIADNGTGVKGVFGLYSFQVESYNAITGFQSYLNWNNTNYSPTDAFMRGDNVSAEIITQIGGYPVRNGFGNTSLFAPWGARVSPTDWTLETGIYDQIQSGQTYYRFGRANLFNTTISTPYGEYTAVSKWFNGTEVGFDHTHLFLTNYTPQISDVYFNSEFGYNFVEGISGQDENRSNGFDLTVTTVNETTGLPRNYLPIPNMTQGITTNAEGNTFLYFHLNYVNINETVFHRGELFEVNVSVFSVSAVTDIDLKVKFEMFYYTKQDWRIFEKTSDTITLHQYGQDGNEALINMTGVFPGVNAQGLNCPIRQGPILMKLTFYVNEIETGTWQPEGPFIQVDGTDSAFEGQILSNYILDGVSSMTFIAPVNRTVGVNLPGVTHYFVNIMDTAGVSTEVNSSKVVFGQAQAIFKNFAPLPLIPTVNRLFNLSGNLTSENPSLFLSGKQVKFELFNGTAWNDFKGTDSLATVTTDSYGFFTKEFNASIFGVSNLIRVAYAGDSQHLSASLNYTLSVIQYNHDIQVLVADNLQLTGNLANYVVFSFFNAGNSTLENLNISVTSAEGYTMQVVQADYVAELSLAAGMSVNREYRVQIPTLIGDSNATFTFTITANSKETLQSITIGETVKIEVLPGTFLNLSLETLPALLFWLIVIVVWIGSLVFFVRKRRAIKAAPAVPKRRFVKVSPAPPSPPEKVTEIPLETKPTPQKPAAKDFDEILEEVKKDEDEDS